MSRRCLRATRWSRPSGGRSVHRAVQGDQRRLYEAGWKAQFISGLIMPMLGFISNFGYLLVSVVGGLLVTRRMITIGDVQAFILYARQFNQPIDRWPRSPT